MPSAFIELIVHPAPGRRRQRREVVITSRSGVRCTFAAGVPADLAAAVLATALAWRRGRRGGRC